MVNSSETGGVLWVDPPHPLKLIISTNKEGTAVSKKTIYELERPFPAHLDVCLTPLRVRHPATNLYQAFAAVSLSIVMSAGQ
jgi:hypothetical protein